MGPSNLPIPLFRLHSRWFPICRLVGRVFRLDCCQIVYLWLLLLLSVKGKKCISILETIRTLLMLNFFPRRSFCFVLFRFVCFGFVFCRGLSSGSVTMFLLHRFTRCCCVSPLCWRLSKRFCLGDLQFDMPAKRFPLPLLSRLFFSYFLLYFRQFAIESHHDFWHLASPFAFLRTWLADFTFVAWEWESSRWTQAAAPNPHICTILTWQWRRPSGVIIIKSPRDQVGGDNGGKLNFPAHGV